MHKIIYFGSSDSLSIKPFQSLLKSEHEILAVVLNNGISREPALNLIPIVSANNLESIAFEHEIRLVYLSAGIANSHSLIRELNPDVIVTSCFNLTLPKSILAVPRLASINIHPSLLPMYKGPDPLFWQIRHAVTETGVTIHLMSETLDSGNIITQKSFKLEKPYTLSMLKNVLAEIAAQQLMITLMDLESRISNSKPQKTKTSCYYSFPEIKDFEVFTDWEAQRIVDFMAATKERNRYYPIKVNEIEYNLTRIQTYHTTLKPKLSIKANHIVIPCKKGHIVAEFLTAQLIHSTM